MQTDVYSIITERMIALIDKGVNPWRKPWVSAGAEAPRNLASGKPYRGINNLLLGMSGYEAPFWLTYRQAEERGGHVRKGEKSSLAVFWKLYQPGNAEPAEPSADGEPQAGRGRPVLRYYHVFNVEQCDGIAYAKPDVPTFAHDPIPAAESIVGGMPCRPEIVHADNVRAWYRPDADKVNIPDASRFERAEEYYSVLFHELAHSTGHESRLGRLVGKPAGFGSQAYGREELIAEMTSAYLCGKCGILDATADNSAAYLDGWRRAIKSDPRAVVVAAGAAQRAADYILGNVTAKPAEVAAEASAAVCQLALVLS